MNKQNLFRKSVAWSLIVALANPAAMGPAFARDTDIFLNATSGATTAEPNVLIVLDTSDSMNYPEAWTEYPGAYDSHVEYLWNDINIINNGAETTAESQYSISTAAVSANPYSPWGFWAGADITARRALWNAAKAYATATEPGDPGPRSTYRNYQDSSWVYWLKAGTATTNAALRSNSFNRFQAMANGVSSSPGTRGGITFPPQWPTPSTTPASPYNYSVITDGTPYNACGSSITQLTPSTVLAPSAVPRNAGVVLNQQWARYEPWLALDAINTNKYPGLSTSNTASSGTSYIQGFLNLVAPAMPAAWPDTSGGTVAGPFRDANTNTMSTSTIFRPIRARNTTNSYAGWTDVRPDLGGYIFGKTVTNTSAAAYPNAVLQNTLAIYGISGLPSNISADATLSTNAKWQATAILGNRDTQSNFELATGLGAYWSTSQAQLTANSICDPVTGVRVPPAVGTNATSANCIDSTTTTSGSAGTSYTSTVSQTCNFVPNTFTETDLTSTTLRAGGSCTNGTVTCNDPSPGGVLGCNTPTACAFTATSNSFTNTTFNSCAWTGRQQVTVTPTCTWSGRTTVQVNPCVLAGRSSAAIQACSWTARTAVTVGSCVKAGRQSVTVPACAKSGRVQTTIGTCGWVGRTQVYVEGVGNFYYGGSCQDGAGSTAGCSTAGTVTQTINGASRSLVTGPFANPVSAAQTASGCTNSVAAGTYWSGGTCTAGGSASNCSFGGSTITGIGNNAVASSTDTVSCSNITAAGTYFYGGTCTAGGVASNCSFGGSTITVGGTSYANATAGTDTASCSNSVAAGTYYTGGSCVQGGVGAVTANCSNTTTASATLNGTSYTNVSAVGATSTAGCANSQAAGNYFFGGTCTSGGGSSNCSFGGSTINVNGTSRNNVVGPGASDTVTCTNTAAAAAGFYYTGGTCADSGGSTANCTISGVSSKTLNVTAYTNVTGAFTTNSNPAEQALGCSGAATTVFYGGTCAGNSSTLGTVAGTALSTTTNQTANCNNAGGTVTINGVTYTQAIVGGTITAGCTNKANVTQTCVARFGAQCNSNSCPASTTGANKTATIGAVAPGTVHNFYQTYTLGGSQDFLVHDCKADETIYNPGAGGSYMYAKGPSGPASSFGAGAGQNKTGAAFTAVSAGSANPNLAYTTSSGLSVAANSGKNIDVYSVNYLNWMFGPKGPSGAPIGRKTRLQIAKDALSDLVQTTNGVRFGLMVFNKSAAIAAGGANDGANVARVIKRMGNGPTDLPDYNNRATLINAINAVTAAARTPLTESIYEAYRYFSGRTPIWGTDATVAQAGGAVSAGRDTTAICGSVGAGCVAAGGYASPMLNNPNTSSPAGCQKNFIVLITDGGPEDDYSANADVKAMSWASNLGGVVATNNNSDTTHAVPSTTTHQFEVSSGTPYGPTDLVGTTYDGGFIWLDELTYFMANADISPGANNHLTGDLNNDSISGRQSVSTYTIGFAGANSPVLQNAAIKGNGVYYTADNSSALSAAIIAALAAITNWTPTGAAPTVPISALNRSENATDVYLAFFQPDPSSEWLGTVKKFQLSQYPNNGDANICGAGIALCLTGQTVLTKAAPNLSPVRNIETITVDPTGNSQTGVDDNAVSFWGPNTLTDGAQPNQGGTGYQLTNTSGQTPETRKVYTFLTDSVPQQNSTSGTVVDLTSSINRVHFSNTAQITACRLGDAAACGGTATMTAITRESRINWIRGGDMGDANCTDGTSTTCTTWRPWPHADVQHSKPAIVTYDATLRTDPLDVPIPPATAQRKIATLQYLYYLQNNGLLTAVDSSTGQEKWTFMVEEALPQIQAMINDSSGPGLYVADGTITAYIDDVNGDGIIGTGDKVYLYFGLRRGGRVYYAIDASDPVTPKFLWKIDANSATPKICFKNGACTGTGASKYAELGQTWSTPFIGKIRGNTNPVMIVGGGYDPAEDAQPPGTRTMGRALFVIDAFTGALVQSWGVGQSGAFLASSSGAMNFSIPSDVTSLNTDLDAANYLDRLYVGDMGGNLWRFDIDDANVNNWTAKRLANLSSDLTAPTQELRKILFPPAAVHQVGVAQTAGGVPQHYDAIYVGTGDREKPLCLTANQTTPTVMNNSCAKFVPADKIFMVIDNDTGLTANDAAAATLASMKARTVTDLGAFPPADVQKYTGWYRDFDNGEKAANAPTVFANKLRFGTYAPLGQSGGACVPAGEGRLNEIDALAGDLTAINGGSINSASRYYSSFVTHGYISTGQLIVQGKEIYHIVVSDSRLQSVRVGGMGSATKIYWYMEPEQ